VLQNHSLEAKILNPTCSVFIKNREK